MSPLPTLVHIVDDDASFRTTTGRLLRVCGYEVAMYELAEQLLERLPDDAHPSCILLDVKIPGLSGPELQDRLAELGSTLPIVFLTGHGDVPTTVRAIKAGAEDFLTKPVSKDKLIDAIERAVARSRAMREKSDQFTALRALIEHSDAARAASFRAGCAREDEQADCSLNWVRRSGPSRRTAKRSWRNCAPSSLAELVLIAERFGILASSSEKTAFNADCISPKTPDAVTNSVTMPIIVAVMPEVWMNEPATDVPPCATMSISQKPGAGSFQSLNVRIGTSRRIAE